MSSPTFVSIVAVLSLTAVGMTMLLSAHYDAEILLTIVGVIAAIAGAGTGVHVWSAAAAARRANGATAAAGGRHGTPAP